MARAALVMEKLLFTRITGLKLKKKTLKCYIWSITLWGTENLTLQKMDRKYLECFEMKCWRRSFGTIV